MVPPIPVTVYQQLDNWHGSRRNIASHLLCTQQRLSLSEHMLLDMAHSQKCCERSKAPMPASSSYSMDAGLRYSTLLCHCNGF